MHYAILAIFKMATFENDENNKRSVYDCYWSIFCIIIDSGNGTKQKRYVLKDLFRIRNIIWAIFKMATFEKWLKQQTLNI